MILLILEKGSLHYSGDKSQFDTLVLLGYVDIIGNRITCTEKASKLVSDIDNFLQMNH